MKFILFFTFTYYLVIILFPDFSYPIPSYLSSFFSQILCPVPKRIVAIIRASIYFPTTQKKKKRQKLLDSLIQWRVGFAIYDFAAGRVDPRYRLWAKPMKRLFFWPLCFAMKFFFFSNFGRNVFSSFILFL